MRPLSSFVSFVALILLAASAAGCGSSSTSPTAPVPNGYALLGTVPAAVNGVPQTRMHTFLLGAAASVSLTLTAATETMLDGSALSTVTIGVGLGTVTNGVCTPIPDAFVSTSSGTVAQLTWSMPAGSDCVLVSDATIQEGPVAYAITLTY